MPQDIIINVRANTAQADRQLQNTERLVTRLYNSANNLITAFQQQGQAAQQAWSSGIQPLLNGIVGLSSRTSGAIHAMNSLERINQRLVASTRNYASALAGLDFSRLNTLVGTMGSLAASFNRAKVALDDMSRSLATLNARTKDIHVTTNNAIAGFGRYGVTAREYLAYRGIKSVGLYADRYQDWINKLTASTGSQETARDIIPNLHKVADSARADIDSIVTLYSRLNLANDHLKLKEDELITVTKALSQSFILSGATSQEAKNAIIQFTQAISKGYLNGDELRSVTEQNIVFTRLLAKEMNTTAGGLRDLGAKGLLTAETLVKVLKDAAGSFDQQIAKMPVTFGQALQKMANAWQMTFSKIANDKQLGQSLVALTDALTKAFSNPATLTAVKLLIDFMKYLADNMGLAAGAAAGFIVQARIIAPLLVKIRHGATVAGLAITGLKHTLRGLIGLGVGAVIGLVVDKIMDWATETDRATEKAREQTSSIDELINKLEDLSQAYDTVAKSIRGMSLERLKEMRDASKIQYKAAQDKLRSAFNKEAGYRRIIGGFAGDRAAYFEELFGGSTIVKLLKKGQLDKLYELTRKVSSKYTLPSEREDAETKIKDIIEGVRKDAERMDVLAGYAKERTAFLNLVRDLIVFPDKDRAYADAIQRQSFTEAAKLSFLSGEVSADMGEALSKVYLNEEEVRQAFGDIFKNKKNADALSEAIAWLGKQTNAATESELKEWKNNSEGLVKEALDKISSVTEGDGGDKLKAFTDFFGKYLQGNIDTQIKAIESDVEKGVKSIQDSFIKNLLSQGKGSLLQNPEFIKAMDTWTAAQAKVTYLENKLRAAPKDEKERNAWMAKYSAELEKAETSAENAAKKVAEFRVEVRKLNKEVYNYQKAITQNATSELMSLIGKGGTVDTTAIEAIFERAKIKEEIKKEQAQLVADLEAAGDNVGVQMHIMETRVKVINELIEKEHEWGKAIESRIEIANRDKEIQKQLDAFAKKGGKSEDMRPILEMGFEINSLTKDLENLLEKSEYLRSGGFASSIRDTLLQFIEQLGEGKQLLIDAQYEIVKANKAMAGTDTIIRNIAEAIKMINEKGGIKNLSGSELAEVQRISSNAKNALNKLNAEKDRLDELIAKLESVKKSFEGVANAVLFVVKVMSAFGVVSKEMVAKIEGMRDDLLQRIGAEIEGMKTTKDALTSTIAEMSTPFDTLNGLIKDTSDNTERLGKNIESIEEPLNSVGKAMHKWIEFQQNIPSFAETLESNMESAAKSVMNWKMDMVDAVSDIGSGIVKSLVKGEDAMESLKNTLSSLADHFIEMSIRMLTYNMFWNLIGGGMTGGMGGGLFSGLFGGLFGHHTGGVIGSDAPSFVRKYHTGGIIGSDEELAILQNGEGVFTRGQMEAIGQGMSANRGNVMVDVRFDPSLKGEVTTEQEVIEQDNQMTKVVLNVIRNNKRTVSSMLGSNTRAQ